MHLFLSLFYSYCFVEYVHRNFDMSMGHHHEKRTAILTSGIFRHINSRFKNVKLMSIGWFCRFGSIFWFDSLTKELTSIDRFVKFFCCIAYNFHAHFKFIVNCILWLFTVLFVVETMEICVQWTHYFWPLWLTMRSWSYQFHKLAASISNVTKWSDIRAKF